MRERAEAAGDGDHAEEHAERRERNAEALGEEQVRERQKASGAEAKDHLDGEEPREQTVAARRVERGAGDRDVPDEQDGYRRQRGADAAACDERA